MIEGKTFFIAGGAGFIGSALVERIVDKNPVIVYDDFTRNALQFKGLQGHANLTVEEGDILDRQRLQYAMEGADIVVHCAAVAGIDSVIQHPTQTIKINTVGTINVLDCAHTVGGFDRVVCFSTSEVFGSNAFRTTERDHSVIGTVGEARWTYAVSKLNGEHAAIAYHEEHGLQTTVLRPFNVYGPGQVGEGALKTFVQRALRDEPIEVHGDGTQIRAWCYISDMIDALLLSLESPEAIGEAFNVGNHRAVITIYGLANTVVRILESKSPIRFVPERGVDVELRVPGVGKARDVLEFEAQVDLEEGIRKTASYYRNTQKVA